MDAPETGSTPEQLPMPPDTERQPPVPREPPGAEDPIAAAMVDVGMGRVDPKATLSAHYASASIELPDGSKVPVLVRRVAKPDGHGGTADGWLVLDDATIDFERRFANTACRPLDHLPPDTAAITKRRLETLREEPSTRIRMCAADLITYLGDPDRIIAQGGLDPEGLAWFAQHPGSLTMARRLCEVVGRKWLQVLPLLPKHIADHRDGFPRAREA